MSTNTDFLSLWFDWHFPQRCGVVELVSGLGRDVEGALWLNSGNLSRANKTYSPSGEPIKSSADIYMSPEQQKACEK